jgi:hypothetical protein
VTRRLRIQRERPLQSSYQQAVLAKCATRSSIVTAEVAIAVMLTYRTSALPPTISSFVQQLEAYVSESGGAPDEWLNSYAKQYAPF